MGELVLHYVEKVEVLPTHPVAGFPGAFVTNIVITGGDGRFEISLHSDKPLEVKGTPKKDYSFPAFVSCLHEWVGNELRITHCGKCGVPYPGDPNV